MTLRCGLITIGAFLLSACASDPPAEAPVAVVTAPTVIEKSAPAPKVEKPPPPTKVVSGEKPAAPAKIATGSGAKTTNQCQGAPQLACINIAGCEGIKRTSPTDKDGRPLTDYCRLKTTASAAR